MNDKLMMQAIRKLPKAWVDNATNVTRFRNSVYAAHPDHPAMRFYDGEWKVMDNTAANR